MNSFLGRLKTIEIVIRNTQGAEDVVKKYENRLREVHTVPTNVQEVESYCSELKVMWGGDIAFELEIQCLFQHLNRNWEI